MAEDLLSDREQEEALRRWWSENWRWVISGVVLGLAVLGGWQYWQQRTQQRTEAAAQIYRDLTLAVNGSEREKADKLVQELDKNYGGSPYADQAHLLMAQAMVVTGKFEQAASELRIVAERSKDDVLRHVAQLRLARVHIQLGHHDEALALLDVAKFNGNGAGEFAAQVHELRGDALYAKGDKSGAQQAYQAALSAAGPKDPRAPGNDLLQLKLQDLSSEQPAAADVVAPAVTPAK